MNFGLGLKYILNIRLIMNFGFGYSETPRNGDGIIRSRTGELRSWEFPRRQKTLEVFNNECDKIEFPGIYILLFEDKKEVYVGEAKNLYNRLKTHMESPEEKLKDWNKVLIINDGRPSSQSDFNDTVIRRTIEHYLIKLLKLNKYYVLAQGEPQKLNATQKTTIDTIIPLVNFLLLKKNLITKTEEKIGEEEVLLDDCRDILEDNGVSVDKWSVKDAIINGKKTFIRPGSKKPKGWQVTVRGKKTGSFIDSLQKGNGYLLMPRDGVLLIPLENIRKIIDDKAFEQDTVDIWINFKENGTAELSYKEKVIDITQFKVSK